MANDLNQLNEVLFSTLIKAEQGEIDDKKAQTIVNIGNAIVNNAKIQLSAFKLTGGRTNLSLVGRNENENLQIAESAESGSVKSDRSALAYDFAQSKGFKNLAEAIAVMGKDKFNKELDGFIEHIQLG